MDIFPSNFLPGDPRLIDQIVYELKSQGIFDQFRKECISDVDTKPAYQNLSQWVEGSVMNFLNQLKFASDTNKNQLREQLRKNITESGFLEVGVERIVDQAVNPKITSVFLPKVEDVVYRFLGIQKPEAKESIEQSKLKTEDLLPVDLEAVSPESVLGNSMNSSIEKKEEEVTTDTHKENDNSLNNSEPKLDDESPAFEPLHENEKFLVQEENSIESNVSNISTAATLNSTKNNEIILSEPVEISQGTSQNNMKQSIATLEEDLKMDVCENTMASECSDQLEIVEEKVETAEEKPPIESNLPIDTSALSKKSDSKKSHDKHKSSRSDKYKRDEKDKGDRNKSESKSKDSRDKSNSKYSSSSKEKDKRDQSNGKDLSQDKEKPVKKESRDRDRNKDDKSNKETKEKLEKVKDRSDKEKSSGKDKSKLESEKQKEKSKWDKDRSSDKDKSSSQKSKEKSSRSSRKDDTAKDKSRRKDDKKDKDEKSSKDKSSSSRDKDKQSSHKDSFNTSKGRIKSNSSSSRDKERGNDKKAQGDSKSRNDKHSNTDKDRSSSAKREKDKVAVDDHYSFKKKISERRSTDRDSNDGSSKMSKSSRFMESFSNNPSKSEGSKSSECFSSESGDSGSNTDNIEKRKHGEHVDNADLGSPIKYIKPKFASNIQEAMRIMKIRKQLAKLERQNQLSLSHVPINQADSNQSSVSTPLSENSEDHLNNLHSSESSVLETTLKRSIQQVEAIEDIPTLKSQDLSMESFQALEARLAQEMSNIDEHMYGEEDENYDYSSIKSNPVKKRKLTEKNYNAAEKIVPQNLENADVEENEPFKTEESDQTKFRGFANADRNHPVVEKLQARIDILLQGINNKIAQIAQLRSQKLEVTTSNKHNIIPDNDLNGKCAFPSTKYKNGEKLIIKISKVEGESCIPKELHKCKQKQNISFDKDIEKDAVANALSKSVLEETKVKYNGQVTADKPANNQEKEISSWENDEVPCRFFDKTSMLVSTAHLKILNREIVGLEASIEDKSLKIQNNVPKLRKQGTKRKAESSENNNRISCGYKPPTKQKLLSDANANQTNKSNVCNTNVSSHQDFLLPLSPAESVKSGEHKKEEPVMVKPKRDSANKRYSSEDLYKPRPVLSCTSRRRSDRFGDVGKS